jgi:hypothetical protein
MERSSELEAIILASPNSSSEISEYNKIQQDQGLKAALNWVHGRFTEEDAPHKN